MDNDLLHIREEFTKELEALYGGCEVIAKGGGQTDIGQEVSLEFNYMGKIYNLSVTQVEDY